MKKDKVVKTVRVTYEQFCEWDFVGPGSFYVRDAMGDYLYVKTGDRRIAQQTIDEIYGKGKYTAVAAKLEKGISKLESGGYSCTGTSTRRGQHRG